MTGVTQQPPGYESVGAVRLPPGNLEPVEEGDSEVEDYGSFASESVLGDVLSNIEEEDEEDSDDEEGKSYPDKDPVFEKIKESLSRTQRSESAQSGLSSMSDGSDGPHVQISSQYTSIPYGIQVRATYEHSSQHADIMGVAYNGRMRQFVILDSKGITTWKRDLVDPRAMSKQKMIKKKSRLTLKHRYFVRRALQYPKYEYRLIMNIVYAPKYNCYFALGKDFSVKVLNRDFEETCSVNTDMRSVLYILFNPVRDELITGGVGGIKIWQFQQVAGKAFTELKPLANYELRIKDTLPNVGGSWVKRVDLDYYLQHLYCCSDTDLHVYDLSGKLLFKFERAHTMSITGCCFSPSSKVLITSSVDSDVKIWSLTGGLVHTFRGHSRAVTGLLLHPETSSVIITASLDGSVRMWSLDTMDLLYMIVVSADGVMWMGLTDDKLLYLSTCRNITLWHLNKFYSFWGLARNQVSHLSLASCEEKTTRVLAVGDDSSVRMFTRSNHKNITTVLPPPDISPLQKVLSVCYSREKNTAFLLITNREIWVYTTRTDPSCRTAIWDVHDLQMPYISGDTTDLPPGVIIQPPSQSMSTHRATENGHGNEIISNCCSLCILNSTAMMWTDEGLCCPIRHTYLLLGMEDGRILFMDPVIKGQKYMELKASKDAIQDMKHDIDHGCLITLCRLKTLLQIQVWGLPQLDAMYELYCGPDITCYARLGLSLMTGHTSGQVNLNILNPMEDTGINKSTQEPPYESIVEEGRRPEHQSGLVAMDSLASMSIYVTCSFDGAIKVWDESKVLLTEVMLEESLSAACFLNDMGDLLIGFKNHIFYIDHTKLCPAFKPPEIEMETSDQESDVYEDPRVLYELIREDEEPVTLKNYLVPYDHLEFDEDFLEGKTKIEQPKTAAEALEESESETETDVSLAPSSIYLSPAESIESLSMIDLTLGADYSKYDLNAQMKTTMDQMVSKGKKRRKHVTIETPGYSDMEEKDLDLELEKFMLPAFGESPGGSPSITPPSGEATPKRAKHRLEDEDSEDSETREEEIYKEATGFVPIEPAKAHTDCQRGPFSTKKYSHSHYSPPASAKQILSQAPTSKPQTQIQHSPRTSNVTASSNTKVKHKKASQHRMPLSATIVSKSPTSQVKVDKTPAFENKPIANRNTYGLQKFQQRAQTAINYQSKKQSLETDKSIDKPGSAVSEKVVKVSDNAKKKIVNFADAVKAVSTSVALKTQTSVVGKFSSIATGSKLMGPNKFGTRQPIRESEIKQPLKTEEVKEDSKSPTLCNRNKPVNTIQSSEYALVLEDIKKELELEEKLRREQQAKEEMENMKAIVEAFEIPDSSAGDSYPQNDDMGDDNDIESVVDSGVGSSVFSEWSSKSAVLNIVAEDEPKSPKVETVAIEILLDTPLETIPEPIQEHLETESLISTHDDQSEPPPKPAEGKSPTSKGEKAGPVDEEEEEEGEKKDKGKVVDMRGIMKKKRRVTSGRAPSLTRRASADHSHDDHDHDHDHGHDDKRSKKDIKKKQQLEDRARVQRMDMSKLASLPPNPPSMLTRKRSLSEARKNFELNLVHQSELHRDSISTEHSGVHGQEEEDIDHIQEEQWAMEAAIHGKTLTIPPQRDKHHARVVNHPDPRLQRMRDRKHMLGEREPVEVNIPGIGSSPTAELEKVHGQHEESDQREKNVPNSGTDEKHTVEIEQEPDQTEEEKDAVHGNVPILDSNAPETQMQRAKRLGLKVDTDKLFEKEKADKNAIPSGLLKRSKLNVYIPQAEREPCQSASTSHRGTPDSGIEDIISVPSIQARVVAIKEPEILEGQPDDPESLGMGGELLSDTDKANAIRRPASSFTGLRRGQQEGERLRAERPHTAHVRFKAELEFIVELPDKLEDLQCAFEEAFKRYQNLPGTPGAISADTLYKNDGTNFEENWQTRIIERHTLLRLQKEIRAQSAAQRRQAIEVIKQDKQNSKLFPSRCGSAIGGASNTDSGYQSLQRANTSMSVPINYSYGVGSAPITQSKARPETANPALEKQQMIKSELSHEKAFRFRLNKGGPAPSRPASSRSISTVADFSPHWIDPRNPDAWRPKSSRSIPSKCNRYILVNKPREKPGAPVPSPLEEQLLVERFPKKGSKVAPTISEASTPRVKKSYSLEYSPFVYQRYV